ncbi:glutamine amidotransferase [Variovorax humicola]|uniref:Glutamine amidotransferase n=1 Tax=Variovorax humicola TaxID=1769758 RepID=A0ABU8VVC8_9BURK
MEDAYPHPLVIIKAGDTFDELRNERGDFEHWIASGLGDTRLPVVVLDPRRGDKLPTPAQLSAVVLTGSHSMVSHREDWSEATAAWLAHVVHQGKPVLGICYGHQLLAHSLGGEADDHPGGLEIGTVTVALTDASADDTLFRDMPRDFPANVVHRQSALRLPPGAVRLAGNAFEPHQAFRIGERAWGVQFHPEFDAAAMQAYIDALADDLRAEGADPDALRRNVKATPAAARLLERFAQLAEAHDAASPSLR